MTENLNNRLHMAKKNKNDEFYTQRVDIDNELKHYKEHFKGKIVLCNCDDPYESNFFKYFASNFNHLGLKKLIATCYKGSPIADRQLNMFLQEEKSDKKAYKIEITEVTDVNNDGAIDIADVEWLIKNDKNVLTELKENGDFRSEECINLLKESDIVVTNPPFSLFREYVAQLFEFKKQFLIIGNMNAITYKEVFPLIMNNKLWAGFKCFGGGMDMIQPQDSFNIEKTKSYKVNENGNIIKNIMGVIWFTNLDTEKRHEKLILYKTYNKEEYPKYDNYDAININKVTDIPMDYDGIMGVPITFLDKYNPEQFEIVGRADANIANEVHPCYIAGLKDKGGAPLINGKFVYKRILIKKR